MDLTPGRRGRAYVVDWEQQCCGVLLRPGEVGEVTLQPFSEVSDLPDLGSVDWHMALHEGFRSEAPPTHRVRARLDRVQEAYESGRSGAVDSSRQAHASGSVRLVDVDVLPGWDPSSPPTSPAPAPAPDLDPELEPEREAGSPTLLGSLSAALPLSLDAPTVTYTGSYEPLIPEEPTPSGWLLDLEILEDLGPLAW